MVYKQISFHYVMDPFWLSVPFVANDIASWNFKPGGKKKSLPPSPIFYSSLRKRVVLVESMFDGANHF